MSNYTKLSRNKTVDITYINPTLSMLLEAFELQSQGKKVAVLSNKSEKRISPIRKDALETVKKLCEITGQTIRLPADAEKLRETVKDVMSVRGAVICDGCVPDETVPTRHGTFLFCGDTMIDSAEVCFTEPTRSILRPWC